MKQITIAVALFLFKTSFSQDYSKCRVFQDLIPAEQVGNETVNAWDLKQLDTVYLNEDWLKKIKIGGDKHLFYNAYTSNDFKGNYRIVYRKEYLREPTLKEKYIIKRWSDDTKQDEYLINKDEKLIVDSSRISKLIPDTAYYDTWFKININALGADIKKDSWLFTIPNISNSDKNSIAYYPSRNEVLTEKLDGTLIDKNYSVFNPEKYINQQLIVSWINHRNNQVEIILRTMDKSVYFIHIFDRSKYYTEYPLFKTEASKRMEENRKKLNDNISQANKDVKFTSSYRALNYFKLNKIYFEQNSKRVFLIADKYNLESKLIKTDTVLYDNTEFYVSDCYVKTTTDYDKAKKIEYDKFMKENFTEKEIQAIKVQKIFIGMSEKALIESLGYPF